MRLYNTLSREIEDLQPIDPPKIKMYCCGPTVYDFTHIGHLRKYTMDDVLKRTLAHLGYQVTHVMNITDVGHLTDDADSGEDKMEKGARKYGKTVWEVADMYTEFFTRSMRLMGVTAPHVTSKATEHIPGMIDMVKTLETRGYTYTTEQAVYFDVTKATDYEHLSGQKLIDKKAAVRDDVVEDPNKRHPADFALWFKRVGKFADHSMHWDSPWGDGFPGWHIECSAMSRQYLGDQIDIHTGGIDHVPVHHTNEIAQSESASGQRPFVRYWVHHNFLMVEGEKMSKSLGNFLTIDDVIGKGFDPMALRLLFLQAHYRSEMNFTWKALEGAQKAYEKLKVKSEKLSTHGGQDETFVCEFATALSEDLNTAKALSHVFEYMGSDSISRSALAIVDTVLGLGLLESKRAESVIPEAVDTLARERANAKKVHDFKRADELRAQIEAAGYRVVDSSNGSYIVTKL